MSHPHCRRKHSVTAWWRQVVMANLVAAMLAALLPSQTFAHKRNFVWQYGAATAFRGEREYEPWLTWNAETNEGEHLTEFEFGITERWTLSPYLIVRKEQRRSWRLQGWKLANRFAFNRFRNNRWLSGAYLEVIRDGGEWELETKLLLSRYGNGRAWNFDLTAERELSGGHEWELEPHLGYSQLLSRSLWLGWEAFANLHDHRYWLGPTVVLDAHYRTRLLLGVAFGLNRGADTQLRFIGGFEF